MVALAVIYGFLAGVALGAVLGVRVLRRREPAGPVRTGSPAVADAGASVRDTLDRMAETLDRVDLDRHRSEVEMSERLRGVADTQRELRRETGLLVHALREPARGGRWGELHLRRLVEVAGMSGVCDIVEQPSIPGGVSVSRPDMIVHLPGGREIVIDSKAPMSAYFEACDAIDPVSVTAANRRYVRTLRSHVRKLAARCYAARLDRSPDFVVMYLPGEHFFSVALEQDPDLIEHAQSQGVLIATPTTLIALLKTVAHVWQHERAGDHVREILTLGRELHARMARSLQAVDLVSRRLNMAVQAQNKAVGSIEQGVLPLTRRFGEIGAVAEIGAVGGAALPRPRRVNGRVQQGPSTRDAPIQPLQTVS